MLNRTQPTLLNSCPEHTPAPLPSESQLKERYRAERAVRKSLERLIPGGIVVLDADGRQSYVNAGFCLLVGWEAQALLGSGPPYCYWPADAVETITRALQAEKEAPSPEGARLPFQRRDGERIDVVVRVTPLDEAGGLVLAVQDVREQRQVEEDHTRVLRERAQLADHLGLLLESTAEGIYGVDGEGRCTFINRAAARRLGYAPGDLLGKKVHELIHCGRGPTAHSPRETCPLCSAGETARGQRVAATLWPRDQAAFPVECSRNPILEGGSQRGTVVSFVDISDRLHLEQQVRQSQKMEAVGRLAGGVAHDFNNLLTIISGYAELLLRMVAPGDPVREHAQEIHRATDRATAVTRQLMLFSRKQMAAPELLDVNAVVLETEKMLLRLIGEDVQCSRQLSPTPGYIKADRSQFQQVLLNLAVNARDAMPKGGTLTLRTALVDLDEATARSRPGVQPGPYVLLEVGDTGCGMTEEVQAHLFEPFFTTKGPGKGTGLGLSTVYGIVKQAGGYVEVTSAAGEGTTFRICLPRHDDPVSRKPEPSPLPPRQGKGTILLVEDEEAVRRLILMVLRWNGYTVLEAARPEEALFICKEHSGPIDLVITDVIMPQMNGRDLALALLRLRANLKVLYISGYTAGVLTDVGVTEGSNNFLQKPFTPDALARKVAELLDTQ